MTGPERRSKGRIIRWQPGQPYEPRFPGWQQFMADGRTVRCQAIGQTSSADGQVSQCAHSAREGFVVCSQHGAGFPEREASGERKGVRYAKAAHLSEAFLEKYDRYLERVELLEDLNDLTPEVVKYRILLLQHEERVALAYDQLEEAQAEEPPWLDPDADEETRATLRQMQEDHHLRLAAAQERYQKAVKDHVEFMDRLAAFMAKKADIDVKLQRYMSREHVEVLARRLARLAMEHIPPERIPTFAQQVEAMFKLGSVHSDPLEKAARVAQGVYALMRGEEAGQEGAGE